MKKYMYWIIAVLLLLAVLLFTLLGKGNPEAGEGSGETTSATETTAPTEITTPTETIDPEEPTSGEGNEAEFVPSVTYKGGPAAIKAILNERNVTSCVVITTVEEAQEKKTDITQDERDLLVDVYKKLADGTMVLPIEGDYVIRDFVDVSFRYEDCRQLGDHNDKPEELEEKGSILSVEFDLDISTAEELMVMAYVDDEWVEIPTVNNGDGTVICEFEDVCPVAFIVLK